MAAAEMSRPHMPSRPTASSAGTRYVARYFSSIMNCVAAASCAVTTKMSPTKGFRALVGGAWPATCTCRFAGDPVIPSLWLGTKAVAGPERVERRGRRATQAPWQASRRGCIDQ